MLSLRLLVNSRLLVGKFWGSQIYMWFSTEWEGQHPNLHIVQQSTVFNWLEVTAIKWLRCVSLIANGKTIIPPDVGEEIFPTYGKKLNLFLIAVRKNSVVLTLTRPSRPNLWDLSPRGMEGAGTEFCEGSLNPHVHQALSIEWKHILPTYGYYYNLCRCWCE